MGRTPPHNDPLFHSLHSIPAVIPAMKTSAGIVLAGFVATTSAYPSQVDCAFVGTSNSPGTDFKSTVTTFQMGGSATTVSEDSTYEVVCDTATRVCELKDSSSDTVYDGRFAIYFSVSGVTLEAGVTGVTEMSSCTTSTVYTAGANKVAPKFTIPNTVAGDSFTAHWISSNGASQPSSIDHGTTAVTLSPSSLLGIQCSGYLAAFSSRLPD